VRYNPGRVLFKGSNGEMSKCRDAGTLNCRLAEEEADAPRRNAPNRATSTVMVPSWGPTRVRSLHGFGYLPTRFDIFEIAVET
jgi:hypothetical protein